MAHDDRDSDAPAKTLIALVRGYVRDVRPDMPATARQKMETAIGSWQWHLGREPTVADLAYEPVMAWIESLRRTGRQRATITYRIGDINKLWKYAHDRGLVASLSPIHAPDVWRPDRPGRNTVDWHFRNAYIAKHATTHALQTFAGYLSAIRRLSAFVGHHVTMDELTLALVDRFHRHSIGAGVGKGMAARYTSDLRLVGRYVKPESFYVRGDMDGVDVDGTLGHYFTTVYAPHKMRNKAVATRHKYQIMLRHFDRFLGRPATLEDLNDTTATDFVFSLELNPFTINGYRKSLLCLWRYAWRKGAVKFGPDVEAVKEYARPPKALTAEQFARLVEAAERFDNPTEGVAGIPSTEWWTSLVLAAYDTGFRIGALLSARFSDLDLTNPRRPWILIQAEAQKTRKWARRPLHAQTAATIQRTMVDGDRELIWPWVRSPSYFHMLAAALFESAGLTEKRLRFHSLRKTAATLVAKRLGVEAARDYLQHTNLSTTLQSYIDMTQIDEERHCDLMPRPRLNGGA